jgi:hypothetical protein
MEEEFDFDSNSLDSSPSCCRCWLVAVESQKNANGGRPGDNYPSVPTIAYPPIPATSHSPNGLLEVFVSITDISKTY